MTRQDPDAVHVGPRSTNFGPCTLELARRSSSEYKEWLSSALERPSSNKALCFEKVHYVLGQIARNVPACRRSEEGLIHNRSQIWTRAQHSTQLVPMLGHGNTPRIDHHISCNGGTKLKGWCNFSQHG
jgi:hypothetical protein